MPILSRGLQTLRTHQTREQKRSTPWFSQSCANDGYIDDGVRVAVACAEQTGHPVAPRHVPSATARALDDHAQQRRATQRVLRRGLARTVPTVVARLLRAARGLHLLLRVLRVRLLGAPRLVHGDDARVLQCHDVHTLFPSCRRVPRAHRRRPRVLSAAHAVQFDPAPAVHIWTPGLSHAQGREPSQLMQRLRRHTLGMTLLHVLRKFNELWMKFFSHRGFFGIESKHFDVLFIVRELLESSLQSAQAYRMSLYVPRVMLNRCYVAVIVINCLLSPLAQHLHANNLPLARLLCLVLDILLDFESSVAIPTFLILSYRANYDFENGGFRFMLWYDGFWVISTINEFKLLFVNTWADLAAQVFFSVSLLLALQNVKSLLRKRTHRVNPSANLVSNGSENRSSVISSFVSDREGEREQVSQPNRWRSSPPPFIQQFAMSMSCAQSAEAAQDTLSSTSRTIIPSTAVSSHPLSKKIAKIFHVLFSIWGVGMLALHMRGESQSTSPECGLSVRPWLSSKVPCALLQINCKALNFMYSLDEMDAILSEIDEDTLAHIVIRHCPAIEISPRVQNFSCLVGMKIYNSTLLNWGQDTALTGAYHPHIVFLFLVHVNMSTFSEGLLSDDFPQQLRDVEFSGTNLAAIPDNLHLKWPTRSGSISCFEQGVLKIVPPVVEHMGPGFLSLVSNEITEIPNYIFTNDNAFTIWLSGNPIEKLPETLVSSTSIRAVHLANTALKSLPTWMDDHFFSHAGLAAGGSPFCEDLLAIVDASFNGGGGSNRTTSVSAAALAAFAAGSIDCEPVAGDYMTYYPSIEEATLDVPMRDR